MPGTVAFMMFYNVSRIWQNTACLDLVAHFLVDVVVRTTFWDRFKFFGHFQAVASHQLEDMRRQNVSTSVPIMSTLIHPFWEGEVRAGLLPLLSSFWGRRDPRCMRGYFLWGFWFFLCGGLLGSCCRFRGRWVRVRWRRGQGYTGNKFSDLGSFFFSASLGHLPTT
jgi:hypothetical protein